jgi:mercuric reductase
MLIVGAGYVALELGQMFRRFGSEVTLIERGPEILSHGYEPEVGPVVRELMAAEGVRVLTSSSVRSVRSDRGGIVATVVVNGIIEELRAETLVVATGRRPNSDRIGLELAGVTVGEDGAVLVDEFLRTNVPHIFAAGDVIGRSLGSQMATPVGSHDGGIVAHNAFSGEALRRVDHRVVPRAIFVDPPVAIVGMTEREAIGAGHPCWCRAVPLSLVPRAGAIRDPRGFVKMVADSRTNEVLGVTMVGHGASEVIHEAAMALRFRARLEDFVDLLHVYPTMAEALKIAAISRFKDPAKLSCCAE